MNKKKMLAVMVAATTFFSSVPAMAVNFTDINNVPWEGAKTYINSVADLGIMVGDYNSKGQLVFRAKDNISYCETMQLVYSLVQKHTGESVTAAIQNKWTSVMNGYKIPAWAQPAVAYGLENKIITISDIPGFINSKGVSVNATRQDVAIMVGRALKDYGTLNSNPSLTYKDKSAINAAAVSYVDLLSRLEVLQGDDLGNFNPKNLINRAEMAVMVSKSHNTMKKAKEEQQTGSISGKITSVAAVGSQTIITINDGSKTMSFTGTDAVPVLSGSARTLLSSVKVDYQVVASYKGQELVSVLVTSTSEQTKEEEKKDSTVEGTFYSITTKNIKLTVDGSTKTYKFVDEDSSEVDFYNESSKTTYDRFKSNAAETKTVKLTLDSRGEVKKAELFNYLIAEFRSIGDSSLSIRVSGSTKSYNFYDKDKSEVSFRIDGKVKTYSDFKREASSGDKVEVRISDDEITEINLVTVSSSSDAVSGSFYSISSDELEIKVNGSYKTYYYPSDNTSNTKFYIDGESVTYREFSRQAERNDNIKIELNSKGYLEKVSIGDDVSDNEVKGTFIDLARRYITIKKSGSSKETDYDYKDRDRDSVTFYYKDVKRNYDYIYSNAKEGDSVILVLDKNDYVTEVRINSSSSSSSSSSTTRGNITTLREDRIKIGNGSYINFVDEDIDECTINIIDGNSKIDDYDELDDAIRDGKTVYVTATVDRNGEVSKLQGYVSYAEGDLRGISLSSEYIEIKGSESRTTIIYYFDKDDVAVSIDDNSYNQTLKGLESALKNEYVYVEVKIDEDGYITEIDAEVN